MYCGYKKKILLLGSLSGLNLDKSILPQTEEPVDYYEPPPFSSSPSQSNFLNDVQILMRTCQYRRYTLHTVNTVEAEKIKILDLQIFQSNMLAV